MTPGKPGTLFVEARLNGRQSGLLREAAEVRDAVRKSLLLNYTEIKVGTRIQLASPLARVVDRVHVSGHNRSRGFPDDTFYLLTENDLDIVVYSLFTDGNDRLNGCKDRNEDDSNSQLFNCIRLPSSTLEGLWETLVYEDPIAELTLRTLTRACYDRRNRQSSWQTHAWQNTVLLHGPPGSGKTTLAQALAQRISIRLSNSLSSAKLLQINTHALFSHYLGETAKKVGLLFKSIEAMASDSSQLVVVIFDEVESVASSRERNAQTNEPTDTLRATNEILKGLDGLREHINVVFMFTTNLMSNLDPAFVDRCYIERAINAPVIDCVYEILRLEINGLIELGIIDFERLVYSEEPRSSSEPSATPQTDTPRTCLSCIPTRQWAEHHWPPTSTTAVSELYKIATLANGLSGRKLKGLVTYARYEYVVDDPGDLRDLLVALEAVVREKTGHEPMVELNAQPERDQRLDVGKFLAQLEASSDAGEVSM